VGFRIRTNTGIEHGPLSLFAYVNYTRGYPNTYSTPPSTMASWITADMSLRFKGSAIAKTGLLHGFEAQISADNIFDRKPPTFPDATFGMLYDPANANPFGRIVSLRLLEHW
jgi:iron complex outermembrane receptor protein